VKNLVVLGAGSIALATAALISPAVAASEPATPSTIDVRGEPYARAVAILKSQGVKQRFNGSTNGPGGAPQAQCIVDQQTSTHQGVMLLHLDCTQEAVADAAGSAPAAGGATAAAPGAPTPGQGTYGGPIGVPVPVG